MGFCAFSESGPCLDSGPLIRCLPTYIVDGEVSVEGTKTLHDNRPDLDCWLYSCGIWQPIFAHLPVVSHVCHNCVPFLPRVHLSQESWIESVTPPDHDERHLRLRLHHRIQPSVQGGAYLQLDYQWPDPRSPPDTTAQLRLLLGAIQVLSDIEAPALDQYHYQQVHLRLRGDIRFRTPHPLGHTS